MNQMYVSTGYERNACQTHEFSLAQIVLTPIRDKILICQTFRSILRPSSVAMYKNQAVRDEVK